MTERIAIRSAKIQESQLLSELAFRSKSYWGYSPEFMEACRAELAVSESDLTDQRLDYVVAELHGRVIGYYALGYLSTDECELEALFVEPQYIGRGIGRKLIEHAKSSARNRGARSMLVRGDPNAAEFYLAAGGIQIGTCESDSIPGRYLPEFRIFLGPENVTGQA